MKNLKVNCFQDEVTINTNTQTAISLKVDLMIVSYPMPQMKSRMHAFLIPYLWG